MASLVDLWSTLICTDRRKQRSVALTGIVLLMLSGCGGSASPSVTEVDRRTCRLINGYFWHVRDADVTGEQLEVKFSTILEVGKRSSSRELRRRVRVLGVRDRQDTAAFLEVVRVDPGNKPGSTGRAENRAYEAWGRTKKRFGEELRSLREFCYKTIL